MKNNFSELGREIWNDIHNRKSLTEHLEGWKRYFSNENLTLEHFKKDFVATRSDQSSYFVEDFRLISNGKVNPFLECYLKYTYSNSSKFEEIHEWVVTEHLFDIILAVKAYWFYLFHPLPTEILIRVNGVLSLEDYFRKLIKNSRNLGTRLEIIMEQLSIFSQYLFLQELDPNRVEFLFIAIAKGLDVSNAILDTILKGETEYQYYELFKDVVDTYYDYKLVSDSLLKFCTSRKERRNIQNFLKKICADEGFVLLTKLV